MYAVCVKFRIKDGFGEVFLKRIVQQADDSLALEQGCHYFDVCHNISSPLEVFLYELYSNEAAFALHNQSDHFCSERLEVIAFALHNQSDHFKSFAADVSGWVEQKEVLTYDVVRPTRHL